MEFHSHDCPLWHSLASGSGAPFIENGFATVPDVPGLGIGELNEELIAELAHEKFKAPWASTEEWDGEWANDRTWS